MHIILIGMKHSGKTTVGKRLAGDLGLPFFDLDDLIIRCYTTEYKTRRSIEEIYKTEGASLFYRIEAHTLKQFLREEAVKHESVVLALGGRTPLNPLIGASLRPMGLVCYINAPFKEVLSRVTQKGTSALLNTHNPESALQEVYQTRHPVYLKQADRVIDGAADVETIVGQIKQVIKEQTDGGK